MISILSESNHNLDIWIGNLEKIKLHAIKYLAELVNDGKVKRILLIQAEPATKNALSLLLDEKSIVIDPSSEVIAQSVEQSAVVVIGINILSNEFQHLRKSKHSSVAFVSSTGIFKNELARNFKQLRIEERTFSHAISELVKEVPSPSLSPAVDNHNIFINRSEDLLRAANLLSKSDFRVIKIMGLPGIGKKAFVSELKKNGNLGTNYFEIYLQDGLNSFADVFPVLLTKLGLKIDLDSLDFSIPNVRSIFRQTEALLAEFDKMKDASIILYNVSCLIDKRSGKFIDAAVSDLFQKLILRSSYRMNKILFLTDINFQLSFECEPLSAEISLESLSQSHIKEIMRVEFSARGFADLAAALDDIDEIQLEKLTVGHPLIAKLLVKASEKYGIKNLLSDQVLVHKFNENQKVAYLLSKIDVSDDELSILQLLSLLENPVELELLRYSGTMDDDAITTLIDKFLLGRQIYQDGSAKFHVPNIVKDVVLLRTGRETTRKNHEMLGAYYWEKSDDLTRKSYDILEGYQRAFYHFTEAGNAEKISLLSLTYKEKIIMKSSLLFGKRHYNLVWELLDNLYNNGELDQINALRFYLDSEVMVMKSVSGTEKKLQDALYHFTGDFKLQHIYAKFLFNKARYPECIKLCELLANGRFPTKRPSTDFLYLRAIERSGNASRASEVVQAIIKQYEEIALRNDDFRKHLLTAYEISLSLQIKDLEGTQPVIKSVIRGIESFKKIDKRVLRFIESETEYSPQIIAWFDEIYRTNYSNFKEYLIYLFRKDRADLLRELIEKVRSLNIYPNLDSEIEKIKSTAQRDLSHYYYVLNRMSYEPNRNFSNNEEIYSYLQGIIKKVDGISLLVDKGTDLMKVRRDTFLPLAIKLFEYKETVLNLLKMTSFTFNNDLADGVIDAFPRHSVYVEGPTDEAYINKAARIFQTNHLDAEIQWIGTTDSKGSPFFTGDTALNQTYSFYKSNPSQLNHRERIMLLYDSDTNKVSEDLGNLCVRVMPRNTDNSIFKKGIENLLVLPDDIDMNAFYQELTKVDDYGAKTTAQKLDKMKLCKWICEELSVPKQKKCLVNIKQILEIIEKAFRTPQD